MPEEGRMSQKAHRVSGHPLVLQGEMCYTSNERISSEQIESAKLQKAFTHGKRSASFLHVRARDFHFLTGSTD